MNGDILINGEIYIKTSSEIYHMSEDEKEYLQELEFEASKEGATEEDVARLEDYIEMNYEDGEEIYEDCEEFWVSMIDEKEIQMIQQPFFSFLASHTKQFSDKKSLDEEFTRLTDFLQKARYVGRYLKRTVPIDSGETTYTSENKSALVLYSTNDLMLLKSNFFGLGFYQMISPRYIKDGNYVFYGDYVDDYKYRDKKSMYREIYQQIINNMRNNNDQKQKSK